MKRAHAVVLRDRIAEWLKQTRRIETDELCPGVVARSARLGENLVIHESSFGAPDVLMIANAETGGLVLVCEWGGATGEGFTTIVQHGVLTAVGNDLDAVATSADTIH